MLNYDKGIKLKAVAQNPFAMSKTFFDKSKAQLQAISKLTLWAQTDEIADLPLRQDLLTKNVLIPAQRELGNSLLINRLFLLTYKN
jgi:hypothetical protein